MMWFNGVQEGVITGFEAEDCSLAHEWIGGFNTFVFWEQQYSACEGLLNRVGIPRTIGSFLLISKG